MELKRSIVGSYFNPTAASSNRTFMELKLAIVYTLETVYMCSNRTFMELKLSERRVRFPVFRF